MRSRTILLLTFSLAACGRGQLDPRGLTGGIEGDGGGGASDGFVGVDTPSFLDSGFIPGSDGAIGPDGNLADAAIAPDGGGRPDVGLRPDGGFRDSGLIGPPDVGLGECLSEVDCFNNLGLPPCPGPMGNWACNDSKCEPICGPPPPVCRNDCDCPFDQSCLGGACNFSGRPNFCCQNPSCPAGSRCVNPDGRPGRCMGGGPDGGITFPDSGVPLRDGGVVTIDAGVGTTCNTDCDCDRNLACVAGSCQVVNRLNLCCDAPFCQPGQMCIDPATGGPGTCGMTPPVPIGAACTSGGPECPGGFCIDENAGFPGGYCTDQCSRMDPCPSGAVCRGTGMGQAICLDSCNAPSECRAGYNCVQLGVGGVGRVCWPEPPTSMNPNGNPVGGECMIDEDCGTGLSCVDQQSGFPGGYCTKLYCDPGTNACPADTSCYAFPGLFSLCLANCPSGGSQSTCRPRYYCLGPTGQPGVCVGN